MSSDGVGERLDPDMCECGHGKTFHGHLDEDDDGYGEHDCRGDGECSCNGFRSAALCSHPTPCQHRGSLASTSKGIGPFASIGTICTRCERRWYGIPIADPPVDVLQAAKDAFMEGRDEEGWSIVAMAFEDPVPAFKTHTTSLAESYGLLSQRLGGK